jgi:hypothetical protein
MHCFVFLKIALITESLTTNITEIWTLPTVGAEMYCKILPVYERLVAHITEIWMLPATYLLMFCQNNLITE